MKYKTYVDLKPYMDKFLDSYKLVEPLYIPPTKEHVRGRKPKKQRICRFCKEKSSPAVKFNQNAHILPELLGKNYGYSDYECDNCNFLFSLYENDLSEFLGLARSVSFIKGKHSIPNFNTASKTINAEISDELGEKKAVTITDLDGKSFNIDIETGLNKITYTKNPYTPINVYKSLLKIALSILPEKDVNYYSSVFDFLISSSNHPAFVQFAKVLIYETNHRVESPGCYLFQKINPQSLIPTHIFKLYFENYIYQFFIPYHFHDRKVYELKEMTTIFCPPILDDDDDTDKWGSDFIDFTSEKKVEGQEGFISYHIDPNFYKDLKMYDAKTKTTYPFIAEDIVKIKIVKLDE